MKHDKDTKIAIDFIDPLFAVVLHISFVQIYEHEQWFWQPRMIFQEPHLFHVSTLALGYLTVILSWIGYHVSMKTCWIDVERPSGRWRFFFDVLLLFAYFVLLVSYQYVRRELWVLAFIFLVFVLWDRAKRIEWQEETTSASAEDKAKSAARRGVTLLWFFVFFLFALSYQLLAPTPSFPCFHWLILTAAILGTILYRFHKDKLWWKDRVLVRLDGALTRLDL